MLFTPLLPPDKTATASCSASQEKWRPWTAPPICHVTLFRSLCGLLNKLTWTTFDLIAHRIAQLARTVESSDDREALVAFVRAIFSRGATESTRQELYALLCQRIIYILEAERNRWRGVDVYHVRNPVQSFETVIRLLAIDEFRRAHAENADGELERLMKFMGVLLVHGVLAKDDIHDTLAVLFEGAAKNNERCAVAICRCLSPVTLAFNAVPILAALQGKASIEHILGQDKLSPKVRYLMMGMLDQVSYPKPRDAFGTIRRRIEAYGIELNDDEYEDDGDEDFQPEESEIDDSEWVQRDCEDWARTFVLRNDQPHLINILHSLKPEHRRQLVRCLVSNALYSEDPSVAARVGSLYTTRKIYDLCQEGKLFVQGLQDELALLADALLDVPNVCQLMSHILRATNLPMHEIEMLVRNANPDKDLAQTLIRQIELLAGLNRNHSSGPDGERLNRFERSSSGGSSPAARQVQPPPSHDR